MLEVLGDRKISLQRELTKLNEEKIYGSLSELCEIDEATLKGEMVIIVEGNKNDEPMSDDEVINRVNYFISKGVSKKDAIEIVSELFGVRKNHIKDLIK